MANKTKCINNETISQDIDNIVISFFDKFNINIYDSKECNAVSHNMLTLCMMEIYNTLFKPDNTMINNQKSIIDYNDSLQLSIIADCFVKWSLWFNKSLGLMQFSIMTGIHRSTLAEWRDNNELNSKRSDVVKSICECHKMEQINLLNGSPVGALAVANNDFETGLEWSKNQLQQITTKEVYYLPATRADKLGLEKLENEL